MIEYWSGEELAGAIEQHAAGAVVDHRGHDVWVKPDRLLDVMSGLKDGPETALEMLTAVTAVDYIDHFQVVYHLLSIRNVRRAVVKVRCGEGRVDPRVPSLMPLWKGAQLQEREVYDLMGIGFDGHENLKRVFLWEGFKGYPHRKDYL